ASAQFRNLRIQSHFRKQGGNFAPQTSLGCLLLFGGAAQNIPHFLFHAAPVPASAALQPCLHFAFDVSDKQLRHRNSPLISRYHRTEKPANAGETFRVLLFFGEPLGDRTEQVKLGQDFVVVVAELDEDGGAIARDEDRDLVNGRGRADDRESRAHDFAHHELLQVLSGQGDCENLIFVDGAHGSAAFKNRELRKIVRLHPVERGGDGIRGGDRHEPCGRAGGRLGGDDLRSGERQGSLNVLVIFHPRVAINLAEISEARVGDEHHHQIVLAEGRKNVHGGGQGRPRRAAGENPFQSRQPPRP